MKHDQEYKKWQTRYQELESKIAELEKEYEQQLQQLKTQLQEQDHTSKQHIEQLTNEVVEWRDEFQTSSAKWESERQQLLDAHQTELDDVIKQAAEPQQCLSQLQKELERERQKHGESEHAWNEQIHALQTKLDEAIRACEEQQKASRTTAGRGESNMANRNG